MRQILLVSGLVFFASFANAQVTYTWNGSASNSWSVPGNWSPAGVPTPTDNIIIVTGSNNCRLQANTSISNLTLTSGVLDLAGYRLSVNASNVVLNAGSITAGRLQVVASGNVSFGAGPLIFNCKTNINAFNLSVRNARFEDSTVFYKTGTGNDLGQGNTIYNGPLDVTNAGSGYIAFGNSAADQFNAPSVFNNVGTSSIYVANSASGHTFNAPSIFNNQPSGTGGIYVVNVATAVTFNADITVTSTAGQGVLFCNGNNTANITLAAGVRINIGAAGFSAGTLLLKQITQLGSAAQLFNTTGTAVVRYGPATVFNAAVSSESPGLLLNGVTFNGVSDLRKTGTSGDWGQGGNIFNEFSTISNAGAGFLVMGNTNPDIWNRDVTFTCTGNERILPSWNAAGTQFNGNIYINSYDSARGIYFCGGSNNASATLAAGRTILPGAYGLQVGYLYLRQFTHLGSTPLNITGSGTSAVYLGPSSDFAAPVNITAPNIYAQGAVYHAPVNFTKTGGTSNHNNANQNIFESTCTIDQQSSTGYFMLGYRSGDQFLNDIIVNSSGTGGIFVGHSADGSTPTLAAGRTIRVGSAGFSQGYLSLRRFTQLGTTPIQLDFTGASTYLQFSDTSVIGGPLTANVPGIYLHSSIFHNTVDITKTGTGNETSQGGNLFDLPVRLVNSGSGNIYMGWNRPDTFSSSSHFESSGSSFIVLASNTTDNYFGGDISFASTGASRGVQFCSSTISGATLRAGRTVSIGANGFSSGTLALRRFRQEGSQPVSLGLSGTGGLLIGPDSRIGGNIISSSPTLQLNGCEFAGTSIFDKSGSTSDYSDGGNSFAGISRITVGGTGFLLLGDKRPDVFNSDVVFTNNGSERLMIGWASVGNIFNGNIYVNTAASATGIRFCGGNTTATATLAAGRTIAVGTDGFNGGYLQLRQFTQLGSVPVSLNLAPTAGYIQYGPMSVFNADIFSSSPGLYFQGSVFNGRVNSTKTGGNTDYSAGGNVFNADAVITNAGTASLLLANTSADEFNSTSSFINTSSANLYVALNGTGNLFRGTTRFHNAPSTNNLIYVGPNAVATSFEGDILVSSVSGSGVQFCNNAGTATLAAGRSIAVAPAGFSAGQLLLRQFTQLGNTPQVLNITNTAAIAFGPASSFGGAVNATAGTIQLQGAVFDGAAVFTKTGSSNDNSAGGNIFNSSASFTDQGTGQFLLGNVNPDVHAGNVSFIQTGTGRVYPNYNAVVSYSGNVYVESPSAAAIVFGSGAGTAILTGASTQNISAASGTPVPVFTRLQLANTGGGVTLNTPVNIQRTLQLSSGLLHTSASNILTMLNASTTAAGNAMSSSYVNGPMRYQKQSSGITTLNFPIGNGSDSRPVILTVNHSNGTLYNYQAQLFNASAKALGYTLPVSISKVSEVHYYTINRFNAAMASQPTADLSGNQDIEVFFGANDEVTDGAQVRVVKNTYNAPGTWINIGGAGAPAYSGGAALTGSVKSTSGPSVFNSFSTFALGNLVGGINVLPVKLLSFQATDSRDAVTLDWATSMEEDNAFFTVERSVDGNSFVPVATVGSKAPGGSSTVPLAYNTPDPTGLQGVLYYRLRITDVHGESSYSGIVKVNRGAQVSLVAYPNPAKNTVFINGIRNGIPTVQAALFDLSGKLVLGKTIAVSAGRASLQFDLPTGIYSLRISLPDGSSYVQQLMVKKD
ncbi:MAG: T9SS type A sorting domain-containing protein [Chitinophagaceae bacterium]|nr:MAG: T9SS type A sorting domain-containing protein [Chitinophagaceae bacterium]